MDLLGGAAAVVAAGGSQWARILVAFADLGAGSVGCETFSSCGGGRLERGGVAYSGEPVAHGVQRAAEVEDAALGGR